MLNGLFARLSWARENHLKGWSVTNFGDHEHQNEKCSETTREVIRRVAQPRFKKKNLSTFFQWPHTPQLWSLFKSVSSVVALTEWTIQIGARPCTFPRGLRGFGALWDDPVACLKQAEALSIDLFIDRFLWNYKRHSRRAPPPHKCMNVFEDLLSTAQCRRGLRTRPPIGYNRFITVTCEAEHFDIMIQNYGHLKVLPRPTNCGLSWANY